MWLKIPVSLFRNFIYHKTLYLIFLFTKKLNNKKINRQWREKIEDFVFNLKYIKSHVVFEIVNIGDSILKKIFLR